MTITETIQKEMNSQQNLESIKKWTAIATAYIATEDAKNYKIQQSLSKILLSSTEYIKWLEYFTIENLRFADDTWNHCPEKISYSDSEYVKKLSLLYRGIEKYANDNYIYPSIDKYGCNILYKIKFNNIGYEIGMSLGEDPLFFCHRVQIENEHKFIDFNDIINNKAQDNTNTIKNSLKDLSNIVISLYENGVPLEAIVISLNNTFNEINQKTETGQSRILKKQ